MVVTPAGKLVDSKHPVTAITTTEVPFDVLDDPTLGTLSRDSNSDCVIDGINLESLVFPGEPPAGDYQVYVRLNRTCGESFVIWHLDLLRRVDAEDGTHPVQTTPLASGELLASQVARDGELGILATTVALP